jgi:hypothetical protein
VNIDTDQLKKILTVQNKAVQMLKSLKSTSDLNFRLSQNKTFKISENVLVQIDSILKEIEDLNS